MSNNTRQLTCTKINDLYENMYKKLKVIWEPWPMRQIICTKLNVRFLSNIEQIEN